MSSISIPRAAISVATSTLTFPDLKSSIALVRWFCDLFPWIASASILFLLSTKAILFARCFVRVKTKTDFKFLCCRSPSRRLSLFPGPQENELINSFYSRCLRGYFYMYGTGKKFPGKFCYLW